MARFRIVPAIRGKYIIEKNVSNIQGTPNFVAIPGAVYDFLTEAQQDLTHLMQEIP